MRGVFVFCTWYTVSMLLTISGLPGSGKTTVAKLLAKKLRVPYVSIGGLRRAMAKERGMTLEEFNALGETKGFTDKDVDRWQAKEAKRIGRGVYEGRLSFYFIPTSFKIFLKSNYATAAKRIFSDPSSIRRFEGSFTTIPQVVRSLKGRVASDTRRYIKYYGVDIFDPRQYDLVLTTTSKTPEQIVEKILAAIRSRDHRVHKVGTKSGLSTRKKEK